VCVLNDVHDFRIAASPSLVPDTHIDRADHQTV